MRKVALFLFLVSILSMGYTCRQRNSDVVTVAAPEKFTAFDTLTTTASDSAAERVKNLMFNSLVRKNESFEYVGELAKDIKISDNGMTLTFTLQDGVKFHNGKAFTSADVKYTFDELFKANGYKAGAFFDTVPLDKDDKAGSTAPPSAPANANSQAANKPAEVKTKRVAHIASLETPDPKTVIFKVTRPALANQLLSNLVAIPIIPEGTVADQKEHPTGSGPFKFMSFDAAQNTVELEGNKEYWNGPPSINRLRVKTVTDASSLQAELQTGAVDIAPNPSNLPPDMIKTLGGNANLRVDQFDGSNVQYLVFNVQKPPLNNAKVRQAIGFAVDRQKIVSQLLLDQARVANSILPPEAWAYSVETDYKFDPVRARQLLQEAGYKNEPISFKYGSGSAMVNQYSQVIQSSLTDVGLNVQITTLDVTTARKEVSQGNYGMYTGVWVGGNQDPIFLRDLFASFKIPSETVNCCNRSFYSNPELDKVVIDAENEIVRARAKELYAKAWRIASGDLPLLPLWYPANIAVSNKRIGNVKMSGSGDWGFLKDITVSN